MAGSPIMKLGIVGSGPSGFYVASRLLSSPALASNPNVRVHMFDRLWAPHGLVRYGVAPDHPEVKNCTHKFDEVAKDPRFRFFGNVNIGSLNQTSTTPISVSSSELRDCYSHILLATGCQNSRSHPSLPFARPFVVPALDIIHWYTGHPSLPPGFTPLLPETKKVSLIGMGNVALDVARMLLTPPSVLASYDIPQHVIETLGSIEEIEIFGRRGVWAGQWGAKEIREMIQLSEHGVGFHPLSEDELSVPEGVVLARSQKRCLDLLRKTSASPFISSNKRWRISANLNPVAFSDGKLTLQNTLTKDLVTKETDQVVQAIGFASEPMSFPNPDQNMTLNLLDEKSGHLQTKANRVLSPQGAEIPALWASGWAANGPKGVLATTMMDSFATAESILASLPPPSPSSPTPNNLEWLDDIPPTVKAGLELQQVVTYEDWKKVDSLEVQRGQEQEKEKERILRWDEVRQALGWDKLASRDWKISV